MFRSQHLLSGRRVVCVNGLTGKIIDPQNGNRGDFSPAVGKNRIRAGHFQQGYIAAAQREREAIIITGEGGDAQPLRHCHQAICFGRGGIIVDADEIQSLDRRDVVRIRQRAAHQHRTMETPIVIDWFVRRARIVGVAGGRKLRGHIPNQGGGRPTFLESGDVGQRLDGGSRLPRADCHIHLAVDCIVIEIRRTDHRQDLARGGADHHQRAVGDMFARQRVHLIADRFLGGILQTRVKRGVNIKPGTVDHGRVVHRF